MGDSCALTSDRNARIIRAIAKDDIVIVECVLSGTDLQSGTPWETYWCALLTFSDGLITEDHSYIDTVEWPGVADILAEVAAQADETTPAPTSA